MKGSVVIFGAGAIGRGLIADLVAANGLSPVFVEADSQLAQDLKQAHGYVVHLTGKIRKDHYVDGYEVLTLEESEEISKALSNCLFTATAVGGQNLKAVASSIALGFKKRRSRLIFWSARTGPTPKTSGPGFAGFGMLQRKFCLCPLFCRTHGPQDTK